MTKEKAQEICSENAIYHANKALYMLAVGDGKAWIYAQFAYHAAKRIGTEKAKRIAAKAEDAFYTGNTKLACRWAIFAARVA